MVDSGNRLQARRLRYERFPWADARESAPRPPVPPRVLGRLEACPRKALAAAIERNGDSYASLSALIRRPRGYLRRFVVDGVPRALRAEEHRVLSDWLGVTERELGVRDLWLPMADAA